MGHCGQSSSYERSSTGSPIRRSNRDIIATNTMNSLVAVAVLLAVFDVALSNRAFPLRAENYAIKQFQLVNPSIKYDETNFLVDLSGRYVLCDKVGQRGKMQITETYKDGTSIHGLVDYGFGPETHANAVNDYIQQTLSGWASDPEFAGSIAASTTFGCSVRPGCENNYVVGCAFDGANNLIATTPRQNDPNEGKLAYAFTEEQYDLAEIITGTTWDRNHYLENLSGRATECGMIGKNGWNFKKEKSQAFNDFEWRVEGMFGSALNLGATQPAMEEILDGMQPIMAKVQSNLVGCSVIPDCISGDQMYVVISCLYKE